MTNTTIPHTLTGVTCGRCSTKGANKIIRKHATIDDVKACFAVGYAEAAAPTASIQVPAGPGEFMVKIPGLDVAVPAPAITVTPKPFGRFMASCTQKGCKRHETRNAKFRFRCPDHKWVKVIAKQLQGTISTSAKHKCDPRCTGAVGNICVCQCGGANHGLDHLVKL